MGTVLMFITNNWLYFVLGALFLIIATVGYIVDDKRNKVENAKEVEVSVAKEGQNNSEKK